MLKNNVPSFDNNAIFMSFYKNLVITEWIGNFANYFIFFHNFT